MRKFRNERAFARNGSILLCGGVGNSILLRIVGNFDFIDTTKKGILCVNSETNVRLPGMVKYYCVGVLGIGCEVKVFGFSSLFCLGGYC